MDKRPSKLARVFCELDLIKCFSTCQRLQVASALVEDFDFTVLLTSRNGTPQGSTHCSELADPNERCIYCLHSEKNLINFAARHGIQMQGKGVVTLYRPCIGCANDLVQAGIGSLYYRWDYDTDNKKQYVLDMFHQRNIYVRKIEITAQEYNLHSILNEWMEEWPNL